MIHRISNQEDLGLINIIINLNILYIIKNYLIKIYAKGVIDNFNLQLLIIFNIYLLLRIFNINFNIIYY